LNFVLCLKRESWKEADVGNEDEITSNKSCSIQDREEKGETEKRKRKGEKRIKTRV